MIYDDAARQVFFACAAIDMCFLCVLFIQAATKNLGELTSLFGVPWATEHIVPSVLKLKDNSGYLQRMTMLNAAGHAHFYRDLASRGCPDFSFRASVVGACPGGWHCAGGRRRLRGGGSG